MLNQWQKGEGVSLGELEAPPIAARHRRIFLAAVSAGCLLILSTPAGAQSLKVTAEVPATADETQGSEGYNSPALVSSPKEPKFVALPVRLDGKDFGCGLQVSGNGGRDWVAAAPVPNLPAGAEKCYAPEVAFDDEGTLYYLFVGLHTGGNTPMGAFITTSTDLGRTFSRPRKVLGPDNFQVRMAIDPGAGPKGRMHLVWLKALAPPGLGSLPAGPNPILAAHSDDGGKSFSDPVQVSDTRRQRVVAPALAVGPGRQVNVVYYDLGDDAVDYHGLEGPTWEGKWSLIFAGSADGGGRFKTGVVVGRVTPAGRVPLIFTMPPAALVVGESKAMFAAWPDARRGDPDILLSRSLDAGGSWGRPRRVNDDPKANGRNQDLPRLGVAPNGRLDAVFLDRRNDPTNLNNDVYYTFSTQNGHSFAPNQRLNSRSFSSGIGRRYTHPGAKGLVEFGSRLGLLSRNDSAVAGWTDTRNSTHPLEQHVFTATVLLPTKGGFPIRMAVLALVLGVLAVGLVRMRRGSRPARPLSRKPPF